MNIRRLRTLGAAALVAVLVPLTALDLWVVADRGLLVLGVR